jgi:hypothetical protein
MTGFYRVGDKLRKAALKQRERSGAERPQNDKRGFAKMKY